jgi:hypothetical protein
MKKFWEQLKPQERRWVTVVAMLFFIVLNYLLVWPRFKQWGQNTARKNAANLNLAKYHAEIVHEQEYLGKIKELESAEMAVPLEDQAAQFETTFIDHAYEHSIAILGKGKLTTRSNDYFLEESMGFDVTATETNLVNLLYSLGSSNSLMRVRSMSLQPADPNRYALKAGLTVVASYKKKNLTPPKPAATATNTAKTTASAATNKPPGLTPPKTNSLTNKPGPLNKKTS